MIKHIVFFRFKAAVSQADRDGFLRMLNGLPAGIEDVLDFQAGFDVIRSERAFDLALVSSFADLAALDRYAKHPHHQPVIQRSRELCEQTASVDYEFH